MLNIDILVQEVNQGVTESLEIVPEVIANFQGLEAALINSANDITAATGGALGGIIGALFGLSETQYIRLVNSLETTATLLRNIEVTTNLTITNLAPGRNTSLLLSRILQRRGQERLLTEVV